MSQDEDADDRPPVEAARRVPLSLRTTPDLRGKLSLAAGQSGRSLAQEVEFRLEESFRAQQTMRLYERIAYLAERVGATIGDSDTGSLLTKLAVAIDNMERYQGVRWIEEASDLSEYDLNVKDIMAAYKHVRARRRAVSLTDFILTEDKLGEQK